MENDILEAALKYARDGLAVFPLKARSKEPATIHGVKDATTNREQIEEWFFKRPGLNIGIATGSKSDGLFIIDVDIDEKKGKNGRDELKKWQHEHGAELPETANAITGGGGFHLLYKTSDILPEVKNRVNMLPGIDIRGEGGYFVAPPSVHPNGKKYEWGQSPEEYGIAPANITIKTLLETPPANGSERPDKDPEQISEGERNNTLFRAACSMKRKGFTDEAIKAAIIEQNKTACIPQLKEKEVETIIKSALKQEGGIFNQAEKIPGKEENIKHAETPEERSRRLDRFIFDIQSRKYKPIPTGTGFFDEMLEGGIDRQTVTLLQGEPAAGKTMLAQQLAEGLASNGQKVIYLNFEMAPEELIARAISAKLYRRGIKKTAREIKRGYKWTENERREILATIEEYRAENLPHISYNPEGVTGELSKLTDYLEELERRAKESKEPGPALFIDYLQIINGPQDIKETLKIAMRALKKYAVNAETFVIVLSAIARTADALNMYASRDTSNNEYNADLIIGLAKAKNAGEDPERGEKMIIKTAKERAGRSGKYATIYRDGAHNIFTGEYRGAAEQEEAPAWTKCEE